MKRLFIFSLAAAATVAAALPAVAGLAGNPSFSHKLPVNAPSHARVVEFEHGRPVSTTKTHGPGEDDGSPRASRTPEAGDDNGGAPGTRGPEPSNRNGALTTHAEPGDDKGGATDSSGGGDNGASADATHGGGDKSGGSGSGHGH